MIILYLNITDVFELQPLVVKSVSTLSLFKLIATGPNVSSIPNQFWCSEINNDNHNFKKYMLFFVTLLNMKNSTLFQ